MRGTALHKERVEEIKRTERVEIGLITKDESMIRSAISLRSIDEPNNFKSSTRNPHFRMFPWPAAG